MATYKFHGDVNEVVPWQAQYTFPTQSTKMQKTTVKLQPKNGDTFLPGQRIRIEFPADNYLNVLNSVLSFDLNIDAPQPIVFKRGSGVTGNTGIGELATVTCLESGRLIAFENANLTTLGATYFDGWRLRILHGSDAGVNFFTTIVGAQKPETDTFQFLLSDALPEVVVTGLESSADFNIFFQLEPHCELRQGGAHNAIQRLRVMYGSMVCEDIQEYKTLVRAITEIGVASTYRGSSGSILEGMHAEGVRSLPAFNNRRSGSVLATGDQSQFEWSIQPRRRRFALNLMSGLLTSKKLIPLKWMAGQFAIEITLAPSAELISSTTSSPTYSLTNVSYIAEMLEFDSTYDSGFFIGLSNMGVPLKFSSWHYHSFNVTGTTIHAQIHERARSIKAAFAVLKDSRSADHRWDPDRFYHALGEYYTPSNTRDVGAVLFNAGDFPVESYQWRVGGRYYPAQPVDCTDGGPEAYSEILKCTDTLGDYRQDSSISAFDWSSRFPGGGGKFIIGAEFEHSDVSPNQISGLNAEEMSDLSLVIKMGANESFKPSTASTATTTTGLTDKRLDVFVNYDALLIVRDGNVVDLVM